VKSASGDWGYTGIGSSSLVVPPALAPLLTLRIYQITEGPGDLPPWVAGNTPQQGIAKVCFEGGFRGEKWVVERVI